MKWAPLFLLAACGMPLPKEVVPIDITGGLATKTGPLVQIAGSFLQLDDVRQERLHEWRNRQGITHADALDDLSTPPLRSVELPGGGLAALNVGGSNTSAGYAYSRNVPSTASRWQLLGSLSTSQITPAQWKRRDVAISQYPPYMTTVAVGNSFRFVAWKPGNPTVGEDAIHVVITSADDGTVIFPDTSIGAAGGWHPRAVYDSASQLFVLFWLEGVNVIAAKWSATTGAFVSGPTTLKTNALATGSLDAIHYTGANITVVYNQTGGNAHQLEVVPSTFALATDADLGVRADFALSLLPDPDASAVRFVAVGTNAPSVRVLRTTSAGAVTTDDLIENAQADKIAGQAYQAGAGWMIVYEGYVAGNFAIKAAKKRSAVVGAVTTLAGGTAAGGSGGAGAGACYRVDSNAWREPGTDPMRYILGLHVGLDVALTGDFQASYFEMALEYENGASTIGPTFTEPQARLIPLNAGPVMTAVQYSPVQVVRTAANKFTVSLARIAQPVISAGRTANVYAVDTWDETVLSQSLFGAAGFPNIGTGIVGPQASYLPAGSLLQSSRGELLVAHGASALPFRPTCALVAFAGGLTVGMAYQYIVTMDMLDDSTAVWRSAGSVASAPITPTAGNTQVDVTVALPTLEQTNRLRTIKIWRTLGNGATAVVQLVHQRTLTCGAGNQTFVFSDQIPDTTLDDSNFLPPGLPASITPAFNHVAFFDGRMWGAERDFPKRLRFSQVNRIGISPEFPSELFKDIEDSEGDITGVASLDDKLVVFKDSAIYWIDNGGPADDGTGSQYVVTLVSSEQGSVSGTPYLSTGTHVWFYSRSGIYRIDRALQIEFIGQAVDKYFNQELTTTPEVPISFTYNASRNEVRLLTTNYRFVYDLIHGVWIRDTGAFVDALYTQKLSNVGDMFFRTNGQVWWDYDTESLGSSTDASGALHGTMRSPWLRGQVEGYIRLYKLRALYAREPGATTTVWPTTTVYFNEDDAIFETDAPAGLTGATKQTVETRTQRMKCSAFSPKITLPTGDLRWRLNGWSALLAVKKVMHAKNPATLGRPFISEPSRLGLVFWVKGDVGLVSSAGKAVSWADQSGFDQDIVEVPLAAPGPNTGVDTIDGIPCISNPLVNGDGRALYRQVGLVDRNGALFGYDTGMRQPRTVLTIMKPQFASAAFNITGGPVCGMGSTPKFQCIFDLEDTDHVNAWYLFSTAWRNLGVGQASEGPATVGGAGGIYNGVPMLGMWSSSGFDNIAFGINGVTKTLSPAVIPGPTGGTIDPGFIFGQTGSGALHFMGAIAECLIYDFDLTADASALALTKAYLSARYPSIVIT